MGQIWPVGYSVRIRILAEHYFMSKTHSLSQFIKKKNLKSVHFLQTTSTLDQATVISSLDHSL